MKLRPKRQLTNTFVGTCDGGNSSESHDAFRPKRIYEGAKVVEE